MKKFTKLVGISDKDFQGFIKNGTIKLQEARLIPAFKTGDELALTSIFLSSLRLIKEYRDYFFKEIKLSRSGKAYFFTEVQFSEIPHVRLDGLILVVSKGKIIDAVILEAKAKRNQIDQTQIEKYLEASKKLKINKLVTVSNEFVSDPTNSPLRIRIPKSISLFHFSWTSLMTEGQLFLFSNNENIQDTDQQAIMNEVLKYFSNPISGITGYTQMKPGWKETVENIRTGKKLSLNDNNLSEAILSWYEEEKDIALLLSRELGEKVKCTKRNKDNLKKDLKKITKNYSVEGLLSVKDSVSDIKLVANLEQRSLSQSVRIIPPLDKGNRAKTTWLNKQIEICKKRNPEIFASLIDKILIEANIKYAKTNIRIDLRDISELADLPKSKEIQEFKILVIESYGASFSSSKSFITKTERFVLNFYEGIVQNLSNWKRPAPKLETSS